MPKSHSVSRRTFIQKTAVAGAVGVAAPYFVSARALARQSQPGANDRLQIGLIGAGGMGRGNLDNCAAYDDVAVTAVCDVWKDRRDVVVNQYKTAKPYSDYREMLQQDDIDGVIIATPPHWHCLIAVEACEAGKDIYLQKPMTLHVAETPGRERSGPAARADQSDRHANPRRRELSTRRRVGAKRPPGKNQRRPHDERDEPGTRRDRQPAQWRTAGRAGLGHVGRTRGNVPVQPADHPKCLRELFVHGLQRRLDPGHGPPHHRSAVLGSGSRCADSAPVAPAGGTRFATPATLPIPRKSCGNFPGITMTWMMNVANSFAFDFGRGEPARRLGIYFHGVNGTVFADYGMHKIVPEGDRMKDMQPPETSIPPSPGHEREWLDCMRSRTQPSCHVDYHYKIDLALNLANLSMRVGRDIRFDEAAGQIVGDPEATRLAIPEYRDPWKFPRDYVTG